MLSNRRATQTLRRNRRFFAARVVALTKSHVRRLHPAKRVTGPCDSLTDAAVIDVRTCAPNGHGV